MQTDCESRALCAVPAADRDVWNGRFLSWAELESADREGSALATVEHPMILSTAQKLVYLAAADPIFLCIQLSLLCFCIDHYITETFGQQERCKPIYKCLCTPS